VEVNNGNRSKEYIDHWHLGFQKNTYLKRYVEMLYTKRRFDLRNNCSANER